MPQYHWGQGWMIQDSRVEQMQGSLHCFWVHTLTVLYCCSSMQGVGWPVLWLLLIMQLSRQFHIWICTNGCTISSMACDNHFMVLENLARPTSRNVENFSNQVVSQVIFYDYIDNYHHSCIHVINMRSTNYHHPCIHKPFTNNTSEIHYRRTNHPIGILRYSLMCRHITNYNEPEDIYTGRKK